MAPSRSVEEQSTVILAAAAAGGSDDDKQNQAAGQWQLVRTLYRRCRAHTAADFIAEFLLCCLHQLYT